MKISHAIEEKTVYLMDGRIFDSPEKAIENRENLIGLKSDELINFMGAALSPKDRLRLQEWLICNRKQLGPLLDY